MSHSLRPPPSGPRPQDSPLARQIAERLERLRDAQRQQVTLRWTARSLVVAAAALVGLALADRFELTRLLPLPPLVVAWVVPVLVVAAGAILGSSRPASLAVVARAVDRALGAQERVLTAHEYHHHPTPNPWLEALRQDALRVLRTARGREVFPLRLPWREGAAALALTALAVGLAQLPNPARELAQQRAAERARVVAEARRLVAVAEELSPADDPSERAETQRAADALRRLGEQIERGELTPEQAAAALAGAEQQLRSLRDATAGPSPALLRQLAADLAGHSDTRAMGEAIARGDFEQAADLLRQFGEQAAGMDKERRDAMLTALRTAATHLRRANPTLAEALQQAADRTQLSEGLAGPEMMERLARALEQAGEQAAARQDLERAAAEVRQSRDALAPTGPQRRERMLARAGEGEQGSQSGGQEGQRPAAAQPLGPNGLPQGDGQQPGAQRPGMAGASAIEALVANESEGQAALSGTGGAQEGGQGSQASESASQAGRGGGQRGGVSAVEGPGALRGPEQARGQSADAAMEIVPDPAVAPGTGGSARVPYSQVFAQYEQRATAAMQRADVPNDMRDLVRDYFSALTPPDE